MNLEERQKEKDLRQKAKEKKKLVFKGHKKVQFLHSIVDTWNCLKEEVVKAINVHKF